MSNPYKTEPLPGFCGDTSDQEGDDLVTTTAADLAEHCAALIQSVDAFLNRQMDEQSLRLIKNEAREALQRWAEADKEDR